MRARSSVLVIVVGVVVVTLASVLSMYPSLSDARDEAERLWREAQPALDQRYDRLAALSRAVRATRGDLELLDEADDSLGDWKALTPKRLAAGPVAANRVEGSAARLARTVTARPSLRQNSDVIQALRDYLGTDPRAMLEAYNESVEKYDRARRRFPGPFFASILGFHGLTTVEVPGALDDLDVPEPPPPPPPPPPAPAPGV